MKNENFDKVIEELNKEGFEFKPDVAIMLNEALNLAGKI